MTGYISPPPFKRGIQPGWLWRFAVSPFVLLLGIVTGFVTVTVAVVTLIVGICHWVIYGDDEGTLP